jgi:release factor glutamine methyltransferase
VCCGSGCIGIALKKKFPHLEVHLSDISEEALTVAKENALKNQVDVTFHQGDLLAPFKGQMADIILCNPPYVSEKEFLLLDPSVKDFEPKLALVGDADGFGFYQRLAVELPEYLKAGGWVFLEMGCTQKKGIETIFEDPIWQGSSSICDLSGRDRFFFLEKQSLSSVSY